MKTRTKNKAVSLYVHIPFCEKKCHYCDFLSGKAAKDEREEYVKMLCLEIREKAKNFGKETVDTIFFGGGTPSVLSSDEISEIMYTLRKEYEITDHAEITIEMNPKSGEEEKLNTYRKLGINRLSIGLQSMSNEELKVLGRIHTAEMFREIYAASREAGFNNINIDLMSALPGQTEESFTYTLEETLKLKPEHISAYSLIIEEGTLFYHMYGPGGKKEDELPSEEEDRKIYRKTKEVLAGYGYERYEISNYARPGYECLHNKGYWTGKEYLGFGIGAASYYRGERFCNEQDRGIYTYKLMNKENILMDRQQLTLQDKQSEFMFLGLRLMEGIREEEFEQRFLCSLDRIYGEKLRKLKEQGLLEYDSKKRRWSLTELGIDISNQVFVEFIELPDH